MNYEIHEVITANNSNEHFTVINEHFTVICDITDVTQRPRKARPAQGW
jgi:hypothetical protein